MPTAATTRLSRVLLLGGGLGCSSVSRAAAMASNPLRCTTTTDTQAAEEKLRVAIGMLPAGKEVLREEIKAYYWWEGAVQNDPEVRLTFDTVASLPEVVDAIAAAHSYDVPMIISDSSNQEALHWKGLLSGGSGASELAERLAASRHVACAQVAADGSLAVKTTAKAKAAVEALAPGVRWVPIEGSACQPGVEPAWPCAHALANACCHIGPCCVHIPPPTRPCAALLHISRSDLNGRRRTVHGVA